MAKALVLIVVVFLASCSLKSEDALQRQFEENKAIIVQILDMQNSDPSIVRIAPTFTRLANDWSWPRKNVGFSEERWNKYRVFFSEARITDGIQKDGSFVWFYVSSEGLAISGTSRGFVYTEQSPKPIVKKFSECPRQEGICYIEVEKNWYLFQWVT